MRLVLLFTLPQSWFSEKNTSFSETKLNSSSKALIFHLALIFHSEKENRFLLKDNLLQSTLPPNQLPSVFKQTKTTRRKPDKTTLAKKIHQGYRGVPPVPTVPEDFWSLEVSTNMAYWCNPLALLWGGWKWPSLAEGCYISYNFHKQSASFFWCWLHKNI